MAPSGEVEVKFTDPKNEASSESFDDLSALFESSGSIEIAASGQTPIIVELSGADLSEPYRWMPSNSADVVTLYNALDGLGNDSTAATITIRDYSPEPEPVEPVEISDLIGISDEPGLADAVDSADLGPYVRVPGRELALPALTGALRYTALFTDGVHLWVLEEGSRMDGSCIEADN